jgi:hypothetical protein
VVRLDILVMLNTPQHLECTWGITAADVRWSDALYPVAQHAMQRGYYMPTQFSGLQPASLPLLAPLRAGFWWCGATLNTPKYDRNSMQVHRRAGGISKDASCGCPVRRDMRSQKCDGCIAARRRAVNCDAPSHSFGHPNDFLSPRSLTGDAKPLHPSCCANGSPAAWRSRLQVICYQCPTLHMSLA